MGLARLRGRMPLVVFVLVAIVCLGLLGFACACLSDQAAQPLERAAAVGSALVPVVNVWAWLIAAVSVTPLVIAVSERGRARASPAVLQRFRF